MHERWFPKPILTHTIIMKIKFHVRPGAKVFSLKVLRSEKIRDVKEKVQNSQRIPIFRQIFLYDDKLLQDEWTVSQCYLYDGAFVLLQVSPENPPSPVFPPWDPSLQLIPPQGFNYPLAIPGYPSSSEVIPMPQPASQTLPRLPTFRPHPSPSHMVPNPLPPPASQTLPWLPTFRPHPSPSHMVPNPLPPPASQTLPWLPTFRPQPSPSNMVPNPLPPPSSTVTLNVKVPRLQDRIPFEMDKVETILHLKMKIAALQEMGGVPVERIVLQSPLMRSEWHDDQVLQNILFTGSADIDVFLRPSLPVPGRNL
ncbi:hypothetical protein JHK82_056377 [Glycine max]|nr:hypothetical protein JHK86_056211 [Glycine max]KAG4918935.1 hypothetical protein JHK85_057216 [Glycine max]KAG5075021.1 hypothetical protein JHK84_056252 [Glycine max]KAG5077682.1 hypothetical protein JHK82_056377 [Glycine max]